MKESEVSHELQSQEHTLNAPDSAIATASAPPPLDIQASGTGQSENGPEGQATEAEAATETSDGELVNQPSPGTSIRQGSTISVRYSVPLDKNNIQASAGETMIFGVVAQDSGSSGDRYTTNYTVAGAGEFDTAGSGTRSKQVNGIVSRNVYMITNSNWSSGTITVTAKIRNQTHNRDEVTIIWTIRQRTGPAPTGLTKVAGPSASSWSRAPAVYTYKATPDRGADGRADYQGQTVLEAFGQVSPLGFTMADLKTTWKRANPTLNTPTKVARHIWNSGGNGTFVFNAQDRIADRHGGFGTTSPFTAAAMADADGIGYRLPQEYRVGSAVIGRCNIDRRYTTANGTQIKKSDPV